MSTKLRETVMVMEDLIRVLDGRDDVELIHRIDRTAEEIEQTCDRKEQQVQEIIREHIASTEQLERHLNEPTEERIKDQQRALERHKAELEKSVSVLERQHKEQENRLENMNQQIKRKEELVVKEKTATAQEVPLVQSSLKLYNTISHISWDYDTSDVQGFCHLPNKKDVRAFHMQPEKNNPYSRARVADELWDLMWLDYTQ